MAVEEFRSEEMKIYTLGRNIIIKEIREKANKYTIEVEEWRIEPKDIYVLLLLCLNEDFDDDLLFDCC